MTTYHFKNHKSNYLIIGGEIKNPGVIGLAVIFDKKSFKQTGKLATASLLGLSILTGGGILAAVAGIDMLGSYLKRTLTIKEPLGKEISHIIESNFAKPMEIKE
ncbi:hypothetical protein MXE80_10180 [Mammaliicoccus sciuri]|uniref:hypothetical protein n=1 Tax=Mammaliicoccus sciuri TaxID=1296 RepID=UPI002DBD0984|nr:hypothetical protein [Mammaliicoccus sciuri]MEB5677417.1 hypothetical protein [Mammaliicoccus sciuri]